MALVTIDSQAISDPGKVEVGKFNLTKSGRSASGKMNMEIIATKRSLTMEWSHINESNLKTILDLLDTQVFHQVQYPDPQGTGGLRTMEAYVGDISEGVWHKVDGIRYWSAVRIGLIER